MCGLITQLIECLVISVCATSSSQCQGISGCLFICGTIENIVLLQIAISSNPYAVTPLYTHAPTLVCRATLQLTHWLTSPFTLTCPTSLVHFHLSLLVLSNLSPKPCQRPSFPGHSISALSLWFWFLPVCPLLNASASGVHLFPK